MLTPIQQNEHVSIRTGPWRMGRRSRNNVELFYITWTAACAVQEQCEEHKNRSEVYIWKVPRSRFSRASVGCAHPAAEAWPDHCRSRYY